MAKGRRILLVEGSGRGFLCHYAHALALGLHDGGHRVLLATGRRDELSNWSGPFAKEACLGDGWSGWGCLARRVLAFRPDVVHFQWIGQPIAAVAFAGWLRRRGIGVVYTPHNLLPHRRRWLSAPAFRLFYGCVDRVVARDAHIAWGLEEMLGVGDDRIVNIPGSPNLMAHPALPPRPAAEVPPRTAGETRLLYFGHGSARKGLGGLLRVLAARGWPGRPHLVIAGEGVLAGADPELLAAVRARMPVTVVDRYVEPAEVAHLFAGVDLLTMPYAKHCKSPLTDLAAAFRLPVLRTDRVAAGRFVEGVHGITVAHGAAAALASALEACLVGGTLPALRAALEGEETVVAATRRLADSHTRLYQTLPPVAAVTTARGAKMTAGHA